MRYCLLVTAIFTCALTASPLHARDTAATLPVSASGVLGIGDAQLTPAFWVGRQAQPQRVILTSAEIAAQNAKLLQHDASMHDLRNLPATLSRAQVTGWIKALSQRPDHPLFDIDGAPVPAATLDALVAQVNGDAVPAQQPTRYGLIVRRAALRTFPTALRVFSERGETDIDRFQETAAFPGTPAVLAHTSADGTWVFVVTPRYAAWTLAANVAEGSAAEVFGYVDRSPYRLVTGAVVRTVFTREQPAVAQLSLDMGTRVPLVTDLPPTEPVNGQSPYTSHVLELPLRGADGRLQFTPALLQKNTDTAAAPLPLTAVNIVTQAFKFLGERYGWGHAYDGRDCSGFVSEVYASMGVLMPRNTSRQAISPAFNRIAFDQRSSRAERQRAVQSLDTGDLVYIPGHVMLVIGRIDGEPYVIHDVSGMRYRRADGSMARIKLNAVSVTPLLPLLFNDRQTYVDRITSIVRMRR